MQRGSGSVDKAPDSQWINAGSKLERRKYSILLLQYQSLKRHIWLIIQLRSEACVWSHARQRYHTVEPVLSMVSGFRRKCKPKHEHFLKMRTHEAQIVTLMCGWCVGHKGACAAFPEFLIILGKFLKVAIFKTFYCYAPFPVFNNSLRVFLSHQPTMVMLIPFGYGWGSQIIYNVRQYEYIRYKYSWQSQQPILTSISLQHDNAFSTKAFCM